MLPPMLPLPRSEERRCPGRKQHRQRPTEEAFVPGQASQRTQLLSSSRIFCLGFSAAHMLHTSPHLPAIRVTSLPARAESSPSGFDGRKARDVSSLAACFLAMRSHHESRAPNSPSLTALPSSLSFLPFSLSPSLCLTLPPTPCRYKRVLPDQMRCRGMPFSIIMLAVPSPSVETATNSQFSIRLPPSPCTNHGPCRTCQSHERKQVLLDAFKVAPHARALNRRARLNT